MNLSMFDGADLNAVYGSPMGGGMETQGFLNAPPNGGMGGGGGGNGSMMVQLPPPPASSTTLEQVLPPPAPAATSHAMPPEVSYQPPEAMYHHTGARVRARDDSIWDKFSSKKYDVLKLVLLSLVILLAMSSDRVIHHYLGKYISGGVFTSMQEFLIRVSYPFVVLLLLWWIKASS